MGRRAFLLALTFGTLSMPLAAKAQLTANQVRRIGVLMHNAEDDPESKAELAAFRQGLQQLGWSEDRNIRIDIRFAADRPDQYQVLAKQLIASQPDAIFAYTTPITAALQRESRTIPIVFAEVSDPVGSKFVASFSRPGGNLTGLQLYDQGITGKWAAMLKEIAPARVCGVAVATMTSTFNATSSAARAGSALELPLGIPVFNDDVATLDVTEVTQSLEEGRVQLRIGRVAP